MAEAIILSKQHRDLTMLRLAHQIVEEAPNLLHTAFIGIQPRGVFVSDTIIGHLQSIAGEQINYGKLDITFYRDDIRAEVRLPNHMEMNFSLENKHVVIIDDVLFTGRTIRAALDAMLDFGRPASVKLCVLVNRRFGRELPIQPDFTGITINTNFNEKVKVNTDSGNVILYS